jgi:hypothetical protein
VRFGEGDLALSKIYFDLLMLGEDQPQLKFIAVQNVVGYIAPPGRLQGEAMDHSFDLKSASRTPMPRLEKERRLERERQDVRRHLEAAKLLVNQLRGFATEAVCTAPLDSELGPEAACVAVVEQIGRQLYGESNAKYIWQALQATDGSELDGVLLTEKEARALLTRANDKHQELTEGFI